MRVNRLLKASIVATGISSVCVQLLTVREFLTQFHGNEITISLVLFSWLLLTGLGSLAAKVFRPGTRIIYSLLVWVIAVWPLIQLIAIRHLREVFFIHGTSPGFYPVFFTIAAAIAPYCLLTGFILPYGLRVIKREERGFTSGDLYLTDNVGDIAGGALFSFLLVYWLTPLPIVAATATPLLVVALLLLARMRTYLLVSAVAVAIPFYYFAANPDFEKQTLSKQYGDIREYIESPYGRVVISQEGNQYTFWESGTPLYSGSNLINSEEKVHFPLAQLDRVGRVLLISGGLGETLGEVFKHHPGHVDYVELDPYLTDAALELGIIQKRPSVTIINMDGRRYIAQTRRAYDAVIIDLPEPETFQINRFFTDEFFALAKNVLTEGGVLSLGLSYSPNFISDVRKKKLSTLYRTLDAHFLNVTVLPGREAYFVCRDQPVRWDIPAALEGKSIETRYIDGFFYGNVTPDRLAALEQAVSGDGKVNTDFEPRLVKIAFQEWFMKHAASPTYFLLCLLGLLIFYLIFMRGEEYVLFSTGLATMGAEMLVIFSFQVIYGYVYVQIGAIVTTFLLGLLPGVLLGNRRGGRRSDLVRSETALLVLLVLFLVWAAGIRFETPPIVFLVYCFVFSFLCGFQFPVAARIIGEERGPAAGLLAADLCGASVGTIAVGTLLIPLAGIPWAVVFLILVKISSTMFTIRLKQRSK